MSDYYPAKDVIIDVLKDAEMTAYEIAEKTGYAVLTIRGYLRELERLGIAERYHDKKGRWQRSPPIWRLKVHDVVS